MNFMKKYRYGFRVLLVGVIFLFGKNGTGLAAQINLSERETIKVEFIETNKVIFVESEIDENRSSGCWNGAGDVIVTVVITYKKLNRLPTRNINELAAVFTAGVSFLQ